MIFPRYLLQYPNIASIGVLICNDYFVERYFGVAFLYITKWTNELADSDNYNAYAVAPECRKLEESV